MGSICKMKSAQILKFEDALMNAEKYIHRMSKWSDKKLERHLDLFRIQKEMAWKDKKWDAYELFCLYEDQVIQARLIRFG